MSAADMAKMVFGLIEAKDTKAAAELLSDDFKFSGPVPDPISGQEWMGLHDKLNAAFPDFSFNLRDEVMEEGDVAHIKVKLSGTHEAELDLSPMGLPNVPSTGKSMNLPEEPLAVTVVDGQGTSVHDEPVEGGGLMGILAQLGVEPPAD